MKDDGNPMRSVNGAKFSWGKWTDETLGRSR